ncbi:MAG: penicillin acylase family protein, partial [bacterium]|nr:penicillin acylase family protein [bacterium]
EWKEMQVQKVSIHIKGGNTIEDELRFTHRGPIVSRFKKFENQSVSLRWIGNLYSNELMGVYKLNRATDWTTFRDAVKHFLTVSQNIVYADVDGNIGLQTSAGLPMRKGAGMNLVPGDTDEYDWTGVVPFEELPYSYNPESGYVSSANNKTANHAYPHYISNWFVLPHRIDRIREMLTEKETLSIDDFKWIQADRKSAHVAKYLPDILKVLKEANGLTAVETEALGLLSNWDRILD